MTPRSRSMATRHPGPRRPPRWSRWPSPPRRGPPMPAGSRCRAARPGSSGRAPGSPPRSGRKSRSRTSSPPGPTDRSGITFADDSLLSIGPNSALVIERFAFDPTTHRGSFETSLRTGTLSAVSGRLTRQSPDAMKVRTPAAILGVRGTEFLVRAGAPAE